jgi:hypothetical protein
MKKIGYCRYVHKSNLDELLNSIPKIEGKTVQGLINQYSTNWEFEVVKYDSKSKKLSLIQSPNWNTANEPTVGDSLVINTDTLKTSIFKKKVHEQIYHQKELFVNENYTGFDVQKAKERTKLWKSKIENLKEHTNKIGYRWYWNELLDIYNIEK